MPAASSKSPLAIPMTSGRIDRLELVNWKSYGGRQVIGPFSDFTSVIGPNGAGVLPPHTVALSRASPLTPARSPQGSPT